MKQRRHRQNGFTLVEIMIVVLTISLLSAIALPAFRRARARTLLVMTANDLKVFSAAFDLYALERAGYPPDSFLNPPYHLPNQAMETYLNAEKWVAETPLGGNFVWEGPNVHGYAGIAIVGSTATESTMRELDAVLDDGNLSTGLFRKMAGNGRYTYLLEE